MKTLGIKYFNETWDLIDLKHRTPVDDLLMIQKAHASLYHWQEEALPINFVRGEWLLSRVYALVHLGEAARYHAKTCLDLCYQNQIHDFDLAFAYEAMARAEYLLENKELFEHYLALSKATTIEKEEDRNYFLEQVKTIKSSDLI